MKVYTETFVRVAPDHLRQCPLRRRQFAIFAGRAYLKSASICSAMVLDSEVAAQIAAYSANGGGGAMPSLTRCSL